MTRVLVTAILASILLVCDATAQPRLDLATSVVTPGQGVTVTVTGAQGDYFALIGSAVNGGFSFAGVPLGVGSDLVILGQGQLDGTGVASMVIVPPFNGTTLDGITCRRSPRRPRRSRRRGPRRGASCETAIWSRASQAPSAHRDRPGLRGLPGQLAPPAHRAPQVRLERRGRKACPVQRDREDQPARRMCVCERGLRSPRRTWAGMSPSHAPLGSEPPVVEVSPVASPT